MNAAWTMDSTIEDVITSDDECETTASHAPTKRIVVEHTHKIEFMNCRTTVVTVGIVTGICISALAFITFRQ